MQVIGTYGGLTRAFLGVAELQLLDMLKTWNETGDIKLGPPPRLS